MQCGVEFRSARFGWLTYARSLGDAEDVTLFDRAQSHNISIYASSEKIAARGRYYDEDAGAAYDVLNYGLDVTFDPFRTWISGRGQLRLKILAEAAKTLIRFLQTPESAAVIKKHGLDPVPAAAPPKAS
jgi:hypothetical protein